MLDEARLGRVPLTGRGWYHYTLEATGDEDQADDARLAYAEREMEAGRKPE